MPLGLTAAELFLKNFVLGIKLVFSNEQTNYFIKILKFLEDAGLLMKGVSETVEHEVKEQKGLFIWKYISR